MKRLPLGIQTFSEIITDDYLYIDKTKDIAAMIERGKYFFLSRPRRFGKSLLVSTIKEIFLGNRDLFEGLYIYDKIQWKQHPVIHIDFSGLDFKDSQQLERSLISLLNEINTRYHLSVKQESLKIYFTQIIKVLAETTGSKPVVLVDEYDKPITDFLTEPEKAKANREVLKNFFGVLKSADSFLRFVFFTGVSKFSKVSIFSGLNNLNDITIDAQFSTILGITQEDITTYFEEYIAVLSQKEGEGTEYLKSKIKRWYNGYSWDGLNQVYNPTSLLSLFDKNRFGNYWFATGTPTFLIEIMRKKSYWIAEIEQTGVGESIFDSYDIENTDNIDINFLLFQTGYLTIKKIEKIGEDYLYNLGSPNHEVKESLLNYIFADFTGSQISKIKPQQIQLIQALMKKDIDRFLEILITIFAAIPYNLHIKDERIPLIKLQSKFNEVEKYYHSLCYMVLALMGVKIDLEVLSDKGRVDGVLTLDEQIYVIEFKMGTAKEAMKQIKARRYYEQYLNRGKEVLLLGVGGFAEKSLEYCLEDCL